MIGYLPHEVEHRLRNQWDEAQSKVAPGERVSFTDWLEVEGIRSLGEAEARIKAERLSRLRGPAAKRLAQQIPGRYASVREPTDDQVCEWANNLTREPWDLQPLDEQSTDAHGRYGTAGPSLLLLGPVGTGKTHEAFGLVSWLFDQDLFRNIRITSAVELYAALRPRPGVDTEETFEAYARADLLMVDDLGTGKNSEFVEETNYRLVDYRYNHELTTIFTTNVAPRELGERLGERTASRLTQMCDRVVLKGLDRRRAAA
ncbi:ATP-binding protein [Saccharomonospora sp. NPDC046836]|uniref:ATP-binding protein n=1 Tax=Saccharomonospora sp. NPDC046836 TaxID=3156921 RepID=UPI00340AF5C7